MGNQFELDSWPPPPESRRKTCERDSVPRCVRRPVPARVRHIRVSALVELSSELHREHASTISIASVHDRVQQAAYASLSESARPELHLRIGRILRELATSSPSRSEAGLRYRRPAEPGRSSDHRASRATRARSHELAAGKRAALERPTRRDSYTSGRASRCFPDGSFGLALRAVVRAASGLRGVCVSRRSLRACRRVLQSVLPRVRTAVEKSELLAIRIVSRPNVASTTRAIQLGREALTALGHPIPSLDTPPLDARSRRRPLGPARRSVGSWQGAPKPRTRCKWRWPSC